MEYKMKFSDLYALGIGFTIGGGVFTLTGVAMNFTGGSTFLVYILGSLAIVFCMLPTIIAASVVPRTGVSYSLSKEAFSRPVGGLYFWIFFIGRIAMAFNATSFAMFFTSVFTTVNPKIAGSLVVLLFFIANMFGTKNAIKVQKIMNYMLYAAFALFIVVGLTKLNTVFVFDEAKFMAGGAKGMFNALSLLIFSLGGGMSVLELGGMVENPEKNLPKACLAVAGTVAILFAGVAIVTAGTLPIVPLAEGGAGVPNSLFFKGPNQAVINAAHALFQNKAMLYFFMIGGACLALTTTINSSFSWYSASCLRAAEDGWFPKSLAKLNKHGSPVYIQLIFVIMGIVPIILAPNLIELNMTLAKLAAGLQILCNVIPNLALLSLPRLYPDKWKNSRFYMSKPALTAITIIPSIATLTLVYFNFSTYPKEILIPVMIILGLGVVYAVVGNVLIGSKEKRQLEVKQN